MNPSPKSPETVVKSIFYEVMYGYVPHTYWPESDEIVVKHKKSHTFWRAVYRVRTDDSDYADPATWEQVEPKQVTITKYEVVSVKPESLKTSAKRTGK